MIRDGERALPLVMAFLNASLLPPHVLAKGLALSSHTHTLLCRSSPPSPQAQAFAHLSEVVIVSFITTVFISAIGAKCHTREEGIQYLDSESFMLHTLLA